jgi:peptide/nickel transport system substrate-binding protein
MFLKRFVCAYLLLVQWVCPASSFFKGNLSFEIPFDSAHPYLETGASTYLLHRPLVRNKEGRYECVLCVDIPTLENGGLIITEKDRGQKNLESTWKLNTTSKWANGDPIVADDFVLAWSLIESGFAAKEGVYRTIRHVKKGKDDREVKISYWGTPSFYKDLGDFFPLPTRLETDPWHLSANYMLDSNYIKKPANEGLYSGDFVFVEKNKYVHRKEKKLSVEGSKKEGADLSRELSYFDFIQRQHIKAKTPQSMTAYQSADFRYIALNLRQPQLANRKIRRALVLFLDREKILRDLYFAGQTVSEHPFRYQKSGQPIAFNPKGGEKLLKELGYVKKDGVWTKDNGTLKFELLYPKNDKDRDALSHKLAESWKQHGIIVDPRGLNQAEFEHQVLGRGNFHSMAIVNTRAPRLSRSLFHSLAVPEITNQYSGQNIMAWQSVEADKLIEAYEYSLAPRELENILGRFIQLYQNELPALPLHYLQKVIVHHPGLKNVFAQAPFFTAFTDQWLKLN